MIVHLLDRDERLRSFLLEAWRTVPFYRRLYGLADPRSVEFSDLPVVTKAELMRHFEDSIAQGRGVPLEEVKAFALKRQDAGQLLRDRYVVSHTSGTTGQRKRVGLSHNNLITNAENICKVMKFTAEDRYLSMLPQHFTYGLNLTHAILMAGGALIAGRQFDSNIPALIAAIVEFRFSEQLFPDDMWPRKHLASLLEAASKGCSWRTIINLPIYN